MGPGPENRFQSSTTSFTSLCITLLKFQPSTEERVKSDVEPKFMLPVNPPPRPRHMTRDGEGFEPDERQTVQPSKAAEVGGASPWLPL